MYNSEEKQWDRQTAVHAIGHYSKKYNVKTYISIWYNFLLKLNFFVSFYVGMPDNIKKYNIKSITFGFFVLNLMLSDLATLYWFVEYNKLNKSYIMIN